VVNKHIHIHIHQQLLSTSSSPQTPDHIHNINITITPEHRHTNPHLQKDANPSIRTNNEDPDGPPTFAPLHRSADVL